MEFEVVEKGVFCKQNVKVCVGVSCNTTSGYTIWEQLNSLKNFFFVLSNMKSIQNKERHISQKIYELAAHRVLNEEISSGAAARQYGICHISFHRYVFCEITYSHMLVAGLIIKYFLLNMKYN